MPKFRIPRMESELEKIIDAALQGDVRDPRLSCINVTGVKLAPDMSFARVYYTVWDDEYQPNEIQEGLDKATGFFRSKIADAHFMRTVPDLRFVYDETEHRAQRIEEIFDALTRERMFGEGE